MEQQGLLRAPSGAGEYVGHFFRDAPERLDASSLELSSFVSFFAIPSRALKGDVAPRRNRARGSFELRSISAPGLAINEALADSVARKLRAQALIGASDANPPTARKTVADFLPVPDLHWPVLSSPARRAVSGLAATSAVTAILLFSGSSSRAVFAEASSITRVDETAASRSNASPEALVTTTTALPAPPSTEVPTTLPPVLEAAAPEAWAIPTPGARLSSRFGNRVNPVSGRWAKHEGVDYAARYGTDIHVVADGVVTQAGWESGYGYYTCVKHDAKTTTCYGHQSKILVKVGQQVSRDDVIGRVGSTGNSTGNHLHFEVRQNGTPVNPLPYL